MYATLEDLLKKLAERDLIELVDDEKAFPETVTAGSEGMQARITEALSDAKDLVDLYLAKRYALPLASVPAVLAGVTADIAVYHLYARRDHAEVPESRTVLHKNAIRMLEQIADGRLQLGLPVDTPTTVAQSAGEFQGNKQMMSNSSLSGF